MSTKTEALPIVATSKVTEMAPKRVFLNIFTDDEFAEFPADHEGITWCEDEVGDDDVEYTRADLATARISELEAEVERLRADAGRYVMWRDNYCAATQGIEINPLLLKLADAWEIADVDAAIDQALQDQKGGA